MNIQAVLPSWRFVHSDEMKAQSRKFFYIIDGFPMYPDFPVARKNARSIVNQMDSYLPLIHRVDQKCGGCVSAALLHFGETDDDSRLPGYRYLLGRAFDEFPLTNEVEYVQSNFRRFTEYVPPPAKKKSVILTN